LGDKRGIRPVKKLCVGFVGGDDFTGALTNLKVIAPVVTITSVILCFDKQRLNQVPLEMAVKTKTE